MAIAKKAIAILALSVLIPSTVMSALNCLVRLVFALSVARRIIWRYC